MSLYTANLKKHEINNCLNMLNTKQDIAKDSDRV